MKRAEQAELSGPRADLAKAIESARGAEAHCEALRASVTRIEDQLYEARGQLERAREEDDEAKSGLVRAIVAGDDLMLLQQPGRSAVREVEQTIEACQSARQMVRNELAEAEQRLDFRALRVRSAIGDVFEAEALDRQITEVERLRAEHERARAVLKFVRGVAPQSYDEKIAAALSPAEQLGPSSTTVAPWRVAFESLMIDASAELPK
jgi:chromosome segregation ATPase